MLRNILFFFIVFALFSCVSDNNANKSESNSCDKYKCVNKNSLTPDTNDLAYKMKNVGDTLSLKEELVSDSLEVDNSKKGNFCNCYKIWQGTT